MLVVRSVFRSSRAQIPAQPLEAAKFFSECVVAERGARNELRTQRLAERNANLVVGSHAAAGKRYTPGAKLLQTSARDGDDQKTNLRQASQSGRSLSEEERANLSAEDRAQAPSQQSDTRSSREQRFLAFIAEKSGKDRNGGRSGR